MSDAARDFFISMVDRARHFGLKPGFASAKFKEEYGEWPPRSWSDEVQRVFALDDEWQKRQEHRCHEQEHFETWERDVKPIADARKAEWLKKNPRSERVTSGVETGEIVSCYQSLNRTRPLHAFEIGKNMALCGRLVSGWLTDRKVFTTSTLYGCKRCKEKLAKRNQLLLPPK